MNGIVEVIENNEFKKKLIENLPDELSKSLDELFNSFKNTLSSNKYIIPVLGVQGSGKSSFLNSVLLKDIILPVDADETTCIPTEISYSNSIKPVATIFYKNRSHQEIDCSEIGLKPYIHNDENPGNEKKVDYISIKFSHPLLKTGVVFVDLPGIGSLTESNVNTTMSYIKKSTGAIFMLRTVPPITKSESIFIQGVLPILSKTFFVQNQWFDERNEEVREGKEHNLEVLNKIYKDKNISLEIDIVNVMSALNAEIKNDYVLLNKSGLPEIKKKLDDFIKNWKITSHSNIKDKLIYYIDLCLEKINLRLELNEKSQEEQLLIYKKEEKTFSNEFDENELKVIQCLELLEEEKSLLNKKIIEVCRIESENFRNKVRERIQGGITDDRLNKVFNDIRIESTNNIYEKIQPDIMEVFYKINSSLDQIEDFSFNKVSHDKTSNFDKQTQVHSKYSKIGGLVGSLSFAAGSYSLSGGLAAVGTAIFPGVGTAVGFGIGLAVSALAGMFGAFLGSATKDVHLNLQKDYAQSQLFKLIDEFNKDISSSYRSNFYDYCNNLEDSINNWLSQQKSNFSNRMKDLKSNYSKSSEDKKLISEKLKLDIDSLNNFYTKLDNLGKLK